MRNRAIASFERTDGAGRGNARKWRTEHPTRRLMLLLLALFPPVGIIAVRLIHLQGLVGVDCFVPFREATAEPIPARNGRILAAGRVMACDVAHFDVYAHYRWIEEPPNPDWLRERALARLRPHQRADGPRVAESEHCVVATRDHMWHELARISDISQKRLLDGHASLQRRVERIRADVNHRRALMKDANDHGSETGDRHSARTAGDEGWRDVWKSVVAELTTPPKRQQQPDPVVVREEVTEHVILRGVPLPVAAEIKAHPERFPGLRIRTSLSREYPHGELAAQVIGMRSRISRAELQEREQRYAHNDPYAIGDRTLIGRSGIERSYDRRLRGIAGILRVIRDRHGHVVQTRVMREPRHGQDVVLTMNPQLQRQAELLLDKTLDRVPDSNTQPSEAAHERPADPSRPQGGCVVAMDVHTGAVLAAASAPRFDLNLAGSGDVTGWNAARDDPRRPFLSRVTQMAIPPGSVFKTLSAVALLESGAVDPDAAMLCRGYLDRPDRHRCLVYRRHRRGHGDVDLNAAIAQSCNVYFFAAARRTGFDALVNWARRFEFGQPTGIDLPFEHSGALPESDTLGLVIGQSRLTVTPLQILRLMAAVANGGYLVTPHVVEDHAPSTSDAAHRPSPARHRISGLDPATLERLRDALRRVVDEPGGTGYRTVRHEQVSIAGKTGTAEPGGGRVDHSWFAGFVPAEQPRVAMVVVVEHGGSGSRVAGPIAREVVQSMIQTGILSAGTVSPASGVAANLRLHRVR